MAAKKKSKKTVTITIDPDTLHALGEALENLAKLGGAVQWAVDDPDVRKAVTKKRPKRR